MSALNWLLISGGNAAAWLWDHIIHLLTLLWQGIDIVVNPLLSPVLALLNPVCTVVGDAIYGALDLLPVWVGLTILSVVAGIIMLLAFRYASNQDGIGRAKDDIKANLLALKLFKDDLRVTVQSQFRIMWAIARLQRYVLTPVILLTLPMLLGLAQMGIRHQWRPLLPGEQTLIHVRLEKELASTPDITLEAPPEVEVEVGPIPGGGELVWRVRGVEPGRHILRFRMGQQVVEKELVVGIGFERVSAVRTGRDWSTQLLHPVESPLPSNTPIRTIEITYPSVDSIVCGANYWVIYLFVVSMITALVFRPLFKVRF